MRATVRRRLRWDWFALAVVAAVLTAIAAGETLRAREVPQTPARFAATDAGAAGETESVPLEAEGVVLRVLGRADPTYWVRNARGSLQFANRAQGFRARLGGGGVVVRTSDGELGLRLVRVGSDALPNPALARAYRNSVVVGPGPVSEWFANGPLGLEQGFTLGASLTPSVGRTLTLTLDVSGNLTPRLVPGAVRFSGAHGAALRYGDLVVTDASGRRLPARFLLDAGRLLIRIGTAGARYPLRVDPLVQDGSKLTEATSVFGVNVAVSTDGTTALVGANPGAWVFARMGSTWTEQAQLVPSGPTGAVGAAVALSSDGNTALVGDPAEGNGDVWVFTRTGTSWSQQGSALAGSDATYNAAFGSSLALSADGNTALIGGHYDAYGGGDAYEGAAWVFARSGSTWTQQGSKLVPNNETNQEGEFGQSVALSENGTIALIGGPGEQNVGAAWVFTNPGSGWTQSAKLLPNNETGLGTFGWSVALSGDGTTALIGGPDDGAFTGAAWVFANSGSGFVQQPGKLIASGESLDGRFGSSVAISADGSAALIGGDSDNGGDNNAGSVGAAWVFTNPGSGWSQQGSKLTPSDESGAGSFGFSVALSGSGALAFIGGYTDHSFAGAAWAFGASTPQTISFTSTNPSPGTVGGPTYTPVATSSSGLPVSITLDAASSGCTLSAGVVTFTAVGTCLIDANQGGNTTYAPATETQQTVTVLAAPAFIADPSIADTATASACASPCALRAAVTAAEASSASQVTVSLLPGTFDLTVGALVVSPRVGQTITLLGGGTSAGATVIEQTGSAGAVIVGNSSSAGPVNLSMLEVTGGRASVGAGIRVTAGSALTLDDSIVTGNSASFSGGGIDTNGTLVVENSLIVGNTVNGFGGGIDNFSETGQGVTVENSTIANNAATGDGGAIYNGAILQISNSTIAGNSAGGHGAAVGGGGFTLSGSILANDTTFSGGGTNCQSTATVTSGGYDLTDDASCGLSTGAHDQLSTNPRLATSAGEPLVAGNGGPTGTVALASTSPAIGAELAGCPSTDQRGAARTAGTGPCDEGAYQTAFQAQTLQFTSPAPSPALVGGATYTPTASASSGLLVSITLDAGSTGCVLSLGGVVSFTAPGSCVLDANQVGNTIYAPATQVQQTITVTAACATPSDTYSASVLADAPIAYYPLSEAHGPAMCDASTAAANGTYASSGLTFGEAGPLLNDSAAKAVEGDGSSSRLLGSGGRPR